MHWKLLILISSLLVLPLVLAFNFTMQPMGDIPLCEGMYTDIDFNQTSIEYNHEFEGSMWWAVIGSTQAGCVASSLTFQYNRSDTGGWIQIPTSSQTFGFFNSQGTATKYTAPRGGSLPLTAYDIDFLCDKTGGGTHLVRSVLTGKVNANPHTSYSQEVVITCYDEDWEPPSEECYCEDFYCLGDGDFIVTATDNVVCNESIIPINGKIIVHSSGRLDFRTSGGGDING